MGRGFRAALLALLVLQLTGSAVQASTWDRIASYLRLLQRAGVKALVAPDCPLGLLGAFHEGKQALLMCGNNLPDDPAVVWVVLAHESAHVMQSCHGGNLMRRPCSAVRWRWPASWTPILFTSCSFITPASITLRLKPG